MATTNLTEKRFAKEIGEFDRGIKKFFDLIKPEDLADASEEWQKMLTEPIEIPGTNLKAKYIDLIESGVRVTIKGKGAIIRKFLRELLIDLAERDKLLTEEDEG